MCVCVCVCAGVAWEVVVVVLVVVRVEWCVCMVLAGGEEWGIAGLGLLAWRRGHTTGRGKAHTANRSVVRGAMCLHLDLYGTTQRHSGASCFNEGAGHNTPGFVNVFAPSRRCPHELDMGWFVYLSTNDELYASPA